MKKGATKAKPASAKARARATAKKPVATEPEPESPAPDALSDERATAILTGVLDDLGSAHHRPFSRS